MPRAHANGIDLEWEEFGNADDPPLLLIMGLGGQMIVWDEEFCALVASHGFRVIRFDNRDVGLSTKIEGGPEPDLLAAFTGDTSSASYTLDDMADDAAGLLDATGIAAAHVVGASMGGMIAQTLAIRHPDKVQTLTSIMSTTGALDVGQPDPAAIPLLLKPPPLDRAGYIEHSVDSSRVLTSPGFRSTRRALASARPGLSTGASTPPAWDDSCWRSWPRATAHPRYARFTCPPSSSTVRATRSSRRAGGRRRPRPCPAPACS